MKKPFVVVVASLALAAGALAAWPGTPSENLVVSDVGVYPTVQSELNDLLPDGQGGYFVVWHDTRTGGAAMRDVFGEHVSADGRLLWNPATDGGAEGKRLAGGNDDQFNARLAPDGAGGFYLAYLNVNALKIERFDGTGTRMAGFTWDVTNVPGQFDIVADGSGGLYALYVIGLNSMSLVRIDASGAPLAGPISASAFTDPRSARLVRDGLGGVLVAYVRSSSAGVFVSRYDASLTPLYQHIEASRNVPLGATVQVQVAPDGVGGAWTLISTFSPDLYLQRVQADAGLGYLVQDGGTAAAALAIATGPAEQTSLGLTGDGTGGAVFAWTDMTSGSRLVLAQRVDAQGALVWPAAGLSLTASAATQVFSPHRSQVSVSDAGAYVTWAEASTASARVARVSLGGTRTWPFGGVNTSTAPTATQPIVLALSPGDDGSAVLALSYSGGGGGRWNAVHMKRVRPDGTLGPAVVDAGVDAGQPDAGPDAGVVDAGLPDAGVDAGTVDSGTPDSGTPDAGDDAGTATDAGASTDAGEPQDAGSGRDAGPSGPEAPYYTWTGCGCSGVDAPAVWWLVAPSLVLLRARRRRTAARTGRSFRGFGSLLSLGLLLVGPSALAQQTTPSAPDAKVAERPRLAFTEVTAAEGVPKATAKAVNETIQTELSALDVYRTVSSADIAQLLGVERQKALLGCSDESESCLTELAGALDADRMLSGTLTSFGNTLLLNLTLLDARKGALIKRVGRRVEGAGTTEAVLDEVAPALFELFSADPLVKGRVKLPEGVKRVAGRPVLVVTQTVEGPGAKREKPAEISLGLRAESNLLAPTLVPALAFTWSDGYLGAAAAVILSGDIGIRAEARLRLMPDAMVNPYVAAGVTVFAPALAPRIGFGASVRLGDVALFADFAFEYFAVRPEGRSAPALLAAVGAGWVF